MVLWQKNFSIRFLSLVLALGLIGIGFSVTAAHTANIALTPAVTPSPEPSEMTVVIDAGHGGEDGGAVSEGGVCEKNINLQIASLLCDMLKESGIRVVMTRTEDTLLYDKSADYQGRKKALDLAARKQIAEESGNCIFVSIHLNSFPLEQYRGLQVWYSKNNPESAVLAERIRSTVKDSLQPENDRACKSATSSIYLLHHLHVPAVLVECGFLSNAEEAALLSDGDYQKKLAATLCKSILTYLGQAQQT